jgi:hypothetical protein
MIFWYSDNLFIVIQMFSDIILLLIDWDRLIGWRNCDFDLAIDWSVDSSFIELDLTL